MVFILKILYAIVKVKVFADIVMENWKRQLVFLKSQMENKSTLA